MLHEMVITYPDDVLLSMKVEKDEFESEARLLLAISLYEQGRISTGMAAKIAGIERVQFMFELARFGLSPIGVTAEELLSDAANA